MYYPYKVILKVKNSDGTEQLYEDFGREQDQSLFLRTAKRLLNEHAHIEGDKFVAQERIDFVSVEQIPDEFRKDWPKGLKSVTVYYFKYER